MVCLAVTLYPATLLSASTLNEKKIRAWYKAAEAGQAGQAKTGPLFSALGLMMIVNSERSEAIIAYC